MENVRLSVNVGCTINIGNFENIKLDLGLEGDISNNGDISENYDELYTIVENKLNTLISSRISNIVKEMRTR